MSEDIQSLPFGDKSLKPGTYAWVHALIRDRLMYENPREHQVNAAVSLLKGRDIVGLVRTGGGKSGILHAVMVAAKEQCRKHLAVGIVPTKLLADDQVRQAAAHGIRAIAIHQDSLEEAVREKPHRNLFHEVKNSKWDLVFLSPEMVQTDHFRWLIRDPSVKDCLFLCVVDEMHLVEEWGKAFRKPYLEIGKLRSRLTSNVTWLGLTATLATKDQAKVFGSLGFTDGTFDLFSTPIDRPEVQYIPGFFCYPHTVADALDISWLVPPGAVSPADIPQSVGHSTKIRDVTRYVQYLESLCPFPVQIPDTKLHIIMPIHSNLTEETRTAAIKAYREGLVRILIFTDCGCYGIDLDIVTFFLLGFPETMAKLLQLLGRCGRMRAGKVYIYAQDWGKLETSDEINGTNSITKISSTTLEQHRCLRSSIEEPVIRFCNATVEMCPRRIIQIHYGDIKADDPFIPPQSCCSLHNPDNTRLRSIAHYFQKSKESRIPRGPGLPQSDGTHVPLDATTRPLVMGQLQQWRAMTCLKWAKATGDRLSMPTMFLPQHQLDSLCDKIHIITARAIFNRVLEKWNHIEESVAGELYTFVEKVLAARKAPEADSAAVSGHQVEQMEQEVVGGTLPLGEFGNVGRKKSTENQPQKRKRKRKNSEKENDDPDKRLEWAPEASNSSRGRVIHPKRRC